jgi:aerobic-type carbon monoxide dehydrogenase small subunit (CoxS/CutS family)
MNTEPQSAVQESPAPSGVSFTVNGQKHTLATHPDRTLLDVLREDLGLTGTKYGCGETQCGACSVLLDGQRVFSCRTPVSRAAGREVLTIEGLSTGDALHPVQQAFLDEDAFQCGFCTPGMILTTVAFLRDNPNPADGEIIGALNGNICRCCSYHNILRAVQRAAGRPSEAD